MAVTRNKKRQLLTSVREHVFQVGAGVICYEGGLAAINPDGYVVPALIANGTDLFCVGVFESFCDNEHGADGDKTCKVKEGIFLVRNGTGINAVLTSDIGGSCYVIDDDQVTRLSDGSFFAGYVRGLESDFVAVELSSSGRFSTAGLLSGPASSNSGELAAFDGVDGKLLKTIPVVFDNGKMLFPNSDGDYPNICLGYSYNGIGASGSAANSVYKLYINGNKIATVSADGIHAARGKVINAGANFVPIYGTFSSPATISFSGNLQYGSTVTNIPVFLEKAYYILPSGQDQDFVSFEVANNNGINVAKSDPNQIYVNGNSVLGSVELIGVGTRLECRFINNIWHCLASGRVSF